VTTHHSRSIQFFTALLWASCLSFSASANAAPLLESLFPFSCEPGQKITVSLTGKQIENTTALIFSIPEVTASLDDKRKLVVAVASGTPPQDCDVWCIVDGEVSNPRRFVISSATNVAEEGKNDSSNAAQTIPFPGAVDGRLEAVAKFDWFQFEATEDQSITLSCRSQSLDGSVQPVVTLFDPDGQEIAHSTGRRREPLLHYKLNSSGTYRVRVSDRAYRSVPDSFYRLELFAEPPTVAAWPDLFQHSSSSKHKLSFYRHTTSDDGQSSFRVDSNRTFMEKLSVATTFPTAELRPAWQSTIESYETFVPAHSNSTVNAMPGSPRIRFTDHQVGYEKEDSTESAANSQPLPAQSLINGRFNSRNDADWYSFEAKKGESFAIDVYGDRLGHLMDIDAVVMDAAGKTLVTFPDMPVPKNPPPVVTPASLDVSATWKTPADGTFHLVLRDLYGSTLYGVDRTYALSLRPLQPSYDVVITPPDDKTPMGYSIPRSGRTGLRVSLLRRDGFAGAVRLNLSKSNENAGLTLDETWIGPGQSSVVAILTSDPEQDAVSPARFLELEATTESPPSQIKNARAVTLLRAGATEGRFLHRLPVSISQELPLNVDLSIVKPEVQSGGKLALSLTHRLDTGKLKADAKIEFPILPAGMKPSSAVLKGGTDNTPIELQIPDKLPPGRYSLAVIVKATVVFAPDAAQAKAKPAPKEQTLQVWSNSVSFNVIPKAKPDSAAPGK
jgi:hypothetical protein